jgi:hypothetical protein
VSEIFYFIFFDRHNPADSGKAIDEEIGAYPSLKNPLQMHMSPSQQYTPFSNLRMEHGIQAKE